jgi:hypothetical protein
MDAVPRALTEQRRSATALALGIWLAALVLLATMALPCLWGRVYTRDDLGSFHLPVRAFYSQQLARHQPFDWMPQLFCGFYLTGEGQAGTYHPWHYVLYRWLPLERAWPLEVLSNYPWMFVGCWMLLRRRLGRPDAAAFGALGFTFSAFNLLHFVHPNAIAIVAHLPWLLWAIDLALTAPESRRRGWALLSIALLTGSQLLLGYPQYVWFSLLAEGVWALMLRAGWRGLLWLAAAKALGLTLGAVQILPTIEALGTAARRGAGAEFSGFGALHPANLVQLVAPYLSPDRVLGLNTHEAGLYLGAVPLALLVWLRTNPEVRRRIRGLNLLAALGTAALFLSFGPPGQLYRIQQILPLVNSFRCPCRYLLLFQFVALILAAAAFGQLATQCRRGVKTPWRELRGLGLLAAVAVAVMILGFALRGHPLIASRRLILAGAALVIAGVWLVAMAARGHRWTLAALVVFTTADLGSYGLSYAVLNDTDTLDHYARLARVPPVKPDLRLGADLLPFGAPGPRIGNQMLLAGWTRVDGYAGLEPARRLNYQQIAALRVAHVGWVSRMPETVSIQGLAVYDAHWLTVPDPLPYVRLASAAVVSRDPGADLPTIPWETTVLVERPVALPPGSPGTAHLIEELPGRLTVEVDAPAPRLLAVAESFHAGWRATVDGQPQEVLRVNGDFLGCRIEGGRHRVALEFRPESLRRGAVLSLVGLGLVLLLAGVQLVRRSRPTLT